MPLVVWGGRALLAFAFGAGWKMSDDLAENIKPIVPWAIVGAGIYMLTKGGK